MEYGLYNKEPVIYTFTGKWMNPFEPTEEMICIEDIAHALSMQCRFGGHVPQFYSVAEHSVLCSLKVDGTNNFAALMHDASEAYLVDIPRPIKNKLTNYHDIEYDLMKVIANKFHFDFPFRLPVKEIDEKMLQWEWEAMMMRSEYFTPQTPQQAEQSFLNQFKLLTHSEN